MSLAQETDALRPTRPGAWPEARTAGLRDWRRPFGAVHTLAASGLLIGLVAWRRWDLQPALGDGGSLALIGGALIGLPHGSSDFLVGHRVFKPILGRCWLPVFLLAYLALVLVVLGFWLVVPSSTLVLFVLISGLHFGTEDLEAGESAPSWLYWTARATTPLVPMIMLHLPEVAPLFGTMIGQPSSNVTAALLPLKGVLLGGWLIVLGAAVLDNARPFAVSCTTRGAETLELVSLALASALLPPLVTFAAYFCLVHAVRHMVSLTADVHPDRVGGALRLAAAVIVPSALVSCFVLAVSWSAILGVMTTDTLLCRALQLIAALTVPHMLLDGLNRRGRRGVPT